MDCVYPSASRDEGVTVTEDKTDPSFLTLFSIISPEALGGGVEPGVSQVEPIYTRASGITLRRWLFLCSIDRYSFVVTHFLSQFNIDLHHINYSRYIFHAH